MLRLNDTDATAPSCNETAEPARESLSSSAPATRARQYGAIGTVWLILWIWSVIQGRGVAELWMGLIGLLFMVSALWRQEHRRLAFWRTSAKRTLSAAIELIEDLRSDAMRQLFALRAMGRKLYLRLFPSRRGFGTALLVLGVGLSVLMVPDVLRYVVQPRARLTAEPLVLAVAAMMIAGGWFLQQRGR